MRKRIFTIGHSTHPADYFLELLKAHAIDCLVDVRSIAASRFNPQYNKSQLSALLAENQIRYYHLHEEFGARQKKEQLLDENGRVDFKKVRATAEFRSGVNFLKDEAEKGANIALMCAEADPLTCHRFAMVSVALKKDFQVGHILKDKTLIENKDLEDKLLKKLAKKLPKATLFDSLTHSQQLDNAYRIMNDTIGYRI